MHSLNSILIEGILEQDPELSHTPKGLAICKFSVAHEWLSKEEEGFRRGTFYFSISCRSRLAETCAEYLKAGRGIRVVGRLIQDEKDEVCILAEHVEFKPTSSKGKVEKTEGEK